MKKVSIIALMTIVVMLLAACSCGAPTLSPTPSVGLENETPTPWVSPDPNGETPTPDVPLTPEPGPEETPEPTPEGQTPGVVTPTPPPGQTAKPTPAPTPTPGPWNTPPKPTPTLKPGQTPPPPTPKPTPAPTPKPTPKPTPTPTPKPNQTYYISPNGSDAGDGSIGAPWKNLDTSLNRLRAGDTLYLRGGTYEIGTSGSGAKNGNYINVRNKKGTEANPIRVYAYANEKPVIDMRKVDPDKYPIGATFLWIEYWHIRGLEFFGMRSSQTTPYINGLFAGDGVNHCTFENINIHDNQGIAMTTGGPGFDYNLFLNCDFHHNFDPYTPTSSGNSPGGNADGLGMKGVPANCNNNVVRGCRFYYNSDDGLDTWESEGRIVIENNWSFRNGYVDGSDVVYPNMNGNGFKLGKSFGTSGQPRVLIGNMAFNNRENGFDDNYCLGPVMMFNNTAYGNGKKGFSFYSVKARPVDGDYFYNNLSVDGSVYFSTSASYRYATAGNSWQTQTGSLVSQVASVDWTLARTARKSDGSLPNISLFAPRSGSAIKTDGVSWGIQDAALPYMPTYPGGVAYQGAKPA